MLDNQSENTYNVIVNNSFEVYKPLTGDVSLSKYVIRIAI